MEVESEGVGGEFNKMMQRRNFIAGTAALVAAAALPTSSLAGTQQSETTFTDDDTLVQRTQKLNALMGWDYEVDVKYPKEWDTQRYSTSREELLGAQFPRLVYNPKQPFEWSVYLKRGELQCTHNMSPFEFFHWTSVMAWQYRRKHAATNSQ